MKVLIRSANAGKYPDLVAFCGEDGRWTLADYPVLTDRVPLASLDCTLALAEIYDKLDLATA